jgi:hypothetical protein
VWASALTLCLPLQIKDKKRRLESSLAEKESHLDDLNETIEKLTNDNKDFYNKAVQFRETVARAEAMEEKIKLFTENMEELRSTMTPIDGACAPLCCGGPGPEPCRELTGLCACNRARGGAAEAQGALRRAPRPAAPTQGRAQPQDRGQEGRGGTSRGAARPQDRREGRPGE